MNTGTPTEAEAHWLRQARELFGRKPRTILLHMQRAQIVACTEDGTDHDLAGIMIRVRRQGG